MTKLFTLLATATLLLALGAGFPANAPATDSPGKPAALAIPTPGIYKIDPDHTFAYFSAWHHVVRRVRGRFDRVTGTITVSRDSAACAVDISIDTASICTQNTERDDDLRGPDFFDAKKFPAMTYRGSGIRRVSASSGGIASWVTNGSLTIRGVSRAVPLNFTFPGLVVIYPGIPEQSAWEAGSPSFPCVRSDQARRFRHDPRQSHGARRAPSPRTRRRKSKSTSKRMQPPVCGESPAPARFTRVRQMAHSGIGTEGSARLKSSSSSLPLDQPTTLHDPMRKALNKFCMRADQELRGHYPSVTG